MTCMSENLSRNKAIKTNVLRKGILTLAGTAKHFLARWAIKLICLAVPDGLGGRVLDGMTGAGIQQSTTEYYIGLLS